MKEVESIAGDVSGNASARMVGRLVDAGDA